MRSKSLLTLLIVPAFAMGVAACDVDQTEEGEMPEVQVEEGQLPSYDVEPADIDVTEDTVTVPDIDINDPDNPPETDGGTTEDGGTSY